MKKSLFPRKLMSLCLIPALLLAGACAQSGADEEITIATKVPVETATTAPDESDAKESDGPNRDEVNLDGGGFQCDWHEVVELTEEDVLPEEELPVAFAEDENFWYDIYEDHVAVVNYIGTDTVVEVPATYEGLPVTVLGQIGENSWSRYRPFYDSDVEEVVLPDGLLVIGDCVFMDCENLEKIVLPDTVTTIGYWAFLGCENLEDIVISDSVTVIGYSAFGVIDYIPWYENLTDEFVIVGDGCLIKYNGDATSVVIPDGVKNICGAFQNDENLVSVTIPESVTRITSYAFSSCTSLENIVIPESVTVLTDSFWNCDSLKEVTGAENVTVVSGFAYCKNLEYFPFAEGLVEIGDSAFSDSGLTEADFPQSLKVIGDRAFMDCKSLTAVKNGQNVIMVGMSSFMGSAWFNSITDYFVTVGKNVLIGYNGEDAEVVVPDTVTYLGGAFSIYKASWSSDPLLSVTLPASVRGCCKDAFSGHPNIQTLTILGENFVFGSNACSSLELESFAVPEGTKIITSSMCSSSTPQEIEIPDSVVIIGDSAFYYSEPVFVDYGIGETAPAADDSLKTVVIPDSVLMIGDLAFADCKDLTDIFIPASVTRIGEDAFEGCPEELTIHGEAGSRAESYAAEYGINFVVDGEEKTETSVGSAE